MFAVEFVNGTNSLLRKIWRIVRYMIMKCGEALDLFSGDEEWGRVSCQWALMLCKIILSRNAVDTYWVVNARVWLQFINIQCNTSEACLYIWHEFCVNSCWIVKNISGKSGHSVYILCIFCVHSAWIPSQNHSRLWHSQHLWMWLNDSECAPNYAELHAFDLPDVWNYIL